MISNYLCAFEADGPVVFPPVVVFPLVADVFPPVVVFPLAVVVFPPVDVFPLVGVVFPVVVAFVGVVFPPLGVVFPPLGVVFPPLGVVAVVFPDLQTGIHLFISLGRVRSPFRHSPKAMKINALNDEPTCFLFNINTLKNLQSNETLWVFFAPMSTIDTFDTGLSFF